MKPPFLAGIRIGLVVLAMLPAAHAGAQSDDAALAEALFQEGRLLMGQGKTEQACPKFAESQRLDPSIGTLLNLALCHDRSGKTASAWAAYKEVALDAKRAGQGQRAFFAANRARQLETSLSKVRIELAEPIAGITVTIEDHELTEAALQTALPLDPGTHDIEVSAPGHEAHRQTIELPKGKGEMVVSIPALEPLPPPPPPPAPVPIEEDEPGEVEISPLVWVGSGVAATGLLVGAVAGGLSLSKAGEFRDACPTDPCHPSLMDLHGEATTLANVSNVGFVFAGAGLIVGGIGLYLSDFGGSDDEARHWAMPQVAANGLVWSLP